jgi:hypothetical protein
MGSPIYKERYAEDALSLTTNGTLHYPGLKEAIIGTLKDGIRLQPTLFRNPGESIILTDILTLRKLCHKCCQPKFYSAPLIEGI